MLFSSFHLFSPRYCCTIVFVYERCLYLSSLYGSVYLVSHIVIFTISLMPELGLIIALELVCVRISEGSVTGVLHISVTLVVHVICGFANEGGGV